VVVTLVGASPLPAPPPSIGCNWFTPLNAIVTIDTWVGGLTVARALGVELPTKSVQATSWEFDLFNAS